jgi:hypothetical protein
MKLSEEAKSIIKEMLISGELSDLRRTDMVQGDVNAWVFVAPTVGDLFYLWYDEDRGWFASCSMIHTAYWGKAEEALDEYRFMVRSEAR